MDSRFFERKCFVTTSESLLKFMQEQEDDIIERVSNELNVEINNIFVDGDKYCAAIYFTVKKLEQ